MYWVDYGGQSIDGFDYIGTDELKVPVGEVTDVDSTIEDIERRCGRFVRVKLFREDDEETAVV